MTAPGDPHVRPQVHAGEVEVAAAEVPREVAAQAEAVERVVHHQVCGRQEDSVLPGFVLT